MNTDQESVRSGWIIRKDTTYLNHGSFGACPIEILEHQKTLRDKMESQPVAFLVGELERLYCQARDALAQFVGAKSQDLVFVRNATEAVNTVIRSFPFVAGDEILVTNHTYDACKNAVDFVAQRSGAKVVVISIPFPLESEELVYEAVTEAVTPKTRFALVDHITSPTALVLPIDRIVKFLEGRGVNTMVDGAHAVGMLDLELDNLNASYYTSNCHKWLCAPKGSAFLHVRKDLQRTTRPLSISHAAGLKDDDPTKFQAEFAWPGTYDPTPYLVVPRCITYLGERQEGGWTALRNRNRTLACLSRQMLLEALNVPAPCPESMLGAMAAIPLSNGDAKTLHDQLITEHGIEAVVSAWPRSDSRLLRVSLQAYNTVKDIEALIEALRCLGIAG